MALPDIRGIDVPLIHQLPEKPAEEHALLHPFDELLWWLKLDESLDGAWAKYTGDQSGSRV